MVSVTAYPVLHKRKSFDICEAFVKGCGGQIATDGVLRPGSAMFFGVDASNAAVFQAVRRDVDRDFYFCDNSFFDSSRQHYFRVAKNRMQHDGHGTSDGRRFDALKVAIAAWRDGGKHVLIAPQSDHFMHTLADYDGDWTMDTVRRIQHVTPRTVRIRNWSSDKAALGKTLPDDLAGAYMLVTWSSAAAVTALLSGVPVHVDSPDCCAWRMSTPMGDFDRPYRPDDRRNWAGVLADNQWSLAEMREGVAWKALSCA